MNSEKKELLFKEEAGAWQAFGFFILLVHITFFLNQTIVKNLLLSLVAASFLFSCSGNSQNEESASSESEAETESSEISEEVSQLMTTGESVYSQYCLACHQTDGKGVPGSFPPLVQTEWVNGENARLISVVLNGLQGEISVNGETYNGVMTPHNFLTDEQVAGVLTYVRKSFGNDAEPVSVEEVTEIRNSAGE